jgi:spermidine/putrescine transport system ATP-binding protein
MAHVPPNKRPTNMVFQSYAIFPHLDVGQNVGFGLRKKGLDKAEMTPRGRRGAGDGGAGGYEKRARRMRCRAGSASAWRWPAR